MTFTRPPAVCGLFYPADPRELERAVESYLDDAMEPPADLVGQHPKALIAPHARYIYSGPIAASAFVHLPRGAPVRRVVLLGPSHHHAFRGIALTEAAGFATPLGVVPVDAEATQCLRALPPVRVRERSAGADDPSRPLHALFLGSAPQDQPAPTVLGGELGLELTVPYDWEYALYDAYMYTDVRVDARVGFDAAGQVSAGIICRYDPALGWYEFNIHPDQAFALLFGQWLAEGIARYTPLVVSRSQEITPTENEIGLVCAANNLTPYINGVQIRTRQEQLHVLSEGKVGVSAASLDLAPLRVSYEWIRVGNP